MNISIVMATHNGRVHLEKQLQSLLAQTYLPQEIVISDDGSTDGTRELLSQYAGTHRHIHVLYAESQGINNNFQNGVSACKGEYIAFCDQDDVWEKDNELMVLLNGIKNLSLKQRTSLNKWQEANHGWNTDENLQSKMTKLIFHSMTNVEDDEKERIPFS